MNFKEYDKFIKNHKNEMLFFEIYYNLTCNDNFEKLNKKEIEKIIYLVYDAYLKDDNFLDLARICDVAIENMDDVLYNNIDKWELLRLCYE